MVAWGGQPFGAAAGALIAAGSTVHSAYVVAAIVMTVTAAFARLGLSRSDVNG
jgi:hypothetical protein